MMQIVLIGVGAGAASALLFASVASGSLLSFLLANFAQLPILIAAIGWTHFAGLTALLVASAGLAVILGGWVGFTFLISIGLPAWWIGYLALLARPAPGAEPGTMEWYPVGRIVVWTALAASVVVLISMSRYGLDAAQRAGRAAARPGSRHALPRRNGARGPAAHSRNEGSRAAGRRSCADRAADEGDGAHHRRA